MCKVIMNLATGWTTCPICESRVRTHRDSWKSHLDRHKMDSARKIQINCETSEFSFTRRAGLKAHRDRKSKSRSKKGWPTPAVCLYLVFFETV
jgi:hypothetical protein